MLEAFTLELNFPFDELFAIDDFAVEDFVLELSIDELFVLELLAVEDFVLLARRC